jgi:hypothetical protein
VSLRAQHSVVELHQFLCVVDNAALQHFLSRRRTSASGALSKLKLNEYELPVQEIKTAAVLDLSGSHLQVEDAIVIAELIKVRKIAKSCCDYN